PSYDMSSTTLARVPSYGAATVSAFPNQLPCSLTIKNLDRSKDPILFLTEDNRIVYELAQLVHTRHTSADETLYQNLMAGGGFSAASRVYVASDRSTPYALRKHVASATYEIIELGPDGSFGSCTKIQTKGFFKNKYHLELPSASSSSPTSSPNPNSASGSGSSTPVSKLAGSEFYLKGSLKGLNITLRHVSNGTKTDLLELSKGVTATQAHFAPLPDSLTGLVTGPFLVAAAYAALDIHREHIQTFTTDENLEELQARVRPSTWDSLFLQAGESSKKQKEFSQQLESERLRDYNEAVHAKAAYPNGIIPAQRSSSRSRSRSHSRSASRTASPAP
ncbi:hypothetical protein BCV70DRAFT_148583, partial [Testicularia cyperi]